MATIEKNCKICGNTFFVKPSRKESARFCSRTCRKQAAGTACSIAGCEYRVYARKVCHTHYLYLLASEATTKPTPSTQERRFWPYVAKGPPVQCWLWLGYRDRKGYGRFRLGKEGGLKTCIAHRFAYELTNGTIPAKYYIHHLCNNPQCVNPRHLQALPPSTHVLTGASPHANNARKTHCKHGHPFDLTNTLLTSHGYRQCRTCENGKKRRIYAKNPRPTITVSTEITTDGKRFRARYRGLHLGVFDSLGVAINARETFIAESKSHG